MRHGRVGSYMHVFQLREDLRCPISTYACVHDQRYGENSAFVFLPIAGRDGEYHIQLVGCRLGKRSNRGAYLHASEGSNPNDRRDEGSTRVCVQDCAGSLEGISTWRLEPLPQTSSGRVHIRLADHRRDGAPKGAYLRAYHTEGGYPMDLRDGGSTRMCLCDKEWEEASQFRIIPARL